MNIPIWPGSSSFFPGKTPFGFYDYDYQFQIDADKVANFCARRLGYPIVDIELQDINFYAAFEEAITTYGNEIYAYKLRQDYLSLEGGSTSIDVNNSIITPNMSYIIRASEQYGTEAGTGGNVTWHTGSLLMTASIQDYDLNIWASQSGIPPSDLEIKRIFYESPPAIAKYFDPYAGTGTGMMNMMDSFGWGNYSPAINFLLMPLNFDIQKIQAIELNDQIRKSNYSFELQNNHLRIFPIPNHDTILYFQYLLKSERISGSVITPPTGSNSLPTMITNVSNVPYKNPQYGNINSIGRSWIFEYTLSIVKEILGYVRGKYSQIPIPGDNVTLNSGDLVGAGANEKIALIDKLRGYLDETSREKLMERRALETDYKQKELQQVPFPVYIG
jgi:hypothetical protein